MILWILLEGKSEPLSRRNYWCYCIFCCSTSCWNIIDYKYTYIRYIIYINEVLNIWNCYILKVSHSCEGFVCLQSVKMPYVKRQIQWIARTVMVKDNNIEEAMQVQTFRHHWSGNVINVIFFSLISISEKTEISERCFRS